MARSASPTKPKSKASKKFAKQLPAAISARREQAGVVKRIKARRARDEARGDEEEAVHVLERHSARPSGGAPRKEELGRLSVDQFMESGFFDALGEASTDEGEEDEPPQRKRAAARAQQLAVHAEANGRAAARSGALAAESDEEEEEEADEEEEEEGAVEEAGEESEGEAEEDDDASVIENSEEEAEEAEAEGGKQRGAESGKLLQLVRQLKAAEAEGGCSEEDSEDGSEGGSEDDEDDDEEEDDDEDEDDEDAPVPNGEAHAGSERPAAKRGHAAQLDALRTRDPDFYAYLQENDTSLLEFGGQDGGEEDEDDDEEDDDEEEDEGEGGAEAEEGGGAAPAPAAARAGAPPAGVAPGPSPLSLKAVGEWRKALTQTHSLRALRLLLSAFRTAVRLGDEPVAAAGAKAGKAGGKDAAAGARGGKKPGAAPPADRFAILHAGVFNELLRLALEQVHLALDHHLLPANGAEAQAEGGGKRRKRAGGGGAGASDARLPDPTASARWPKLSGLVKTYLGLCLELLPKAGTPDVCVALLGQLRSLLPYARPFPLLTKRLLKALLAVWGEHPSLDARLAAFGVLSRLSAAFPPPALELCLKGAYLTFARTASLPSRRSLPHVLLMTNCLVELYSRDAQLAYEHGFVYLRQIAVHVRSALNARRDAAARAHESVYNWQVLNCLRCWGAVVCAHGRDEGCQLRLLAFPLVQTTLALARLLPASRYVPLRLQCVRLLNELGRCLSLHIPVTADLFEILDKAELGKKPAAMARGRPLDWACSLKVAKGVVGSRAFQDGMVGRMLLHLTDWLGLNSGTISFPEMAVPVLAELQRAAKSAKVARFHRQIKQLIATVRASSGLVLQARAKVNFAPKDLDRVREFERALAARGETPLQRLAREEKRAAEERDAQFAKGAVGDEEEEGGSSSEGGEEGEGEEGAEPPAKRPHKAAKAKGKRQGAQAAPQAELPARTANPGSEDVLREFDASDFFS